MKLLLAAFLLLASCTYASKGQTDKTFTFLPDDRGFWKAEIAPPENLFKPISKALSIHPDTASDTHSGAGCDLEHNKHYIYCSRIGHWSMKPSFLTIVVKCKEERCTVDTDTKELITFKKDMSDPDELGLWKATKDYPDYLVPYIRHGLSTNSVTAFRTYSGAGCDVQVDKMYILCDRIGLRREKHSISNIWVVCHRRKCTVYTSRFQYITSV